MGRVKGTRIIGRQHVLMVGGCSTSLPAQIWVCFDSVCLGNGNGTRTKMICVRDIYFSSEREESLGTYKSPNRKCASETARERLYLFFQLSC